METQDKAEDLMLSGLGSQMLFDMSMAIISAPVRAGAGKVKKALHRDGKRTEGGDQSDAQCENLGKNILV